MGIVNVKYNNKYISQRIVSYVFVILILICVWAAAWGISDILTLYPRYLMTTWEEAGTMNDEDAWKDALASVELAKSINVSSPEKLFDMARLFEWKALQVPVWTQQAHYYRGEAIKQYQEALNKRPTWAIAWVSLAQNKFLNQEMDPQMWAALRNAIMYGPWEMVVQRKIIWLGIATWKYMPTDLRVAVNNVIVNSLDNRMLIDFILSTAVRYQWEKNLISKVDEEQMKRLKLFIQSRG